MTTASRIISALRSGVVPEEGLELFATGLEALEAAIAEALGEVAAGRGAVDQHEAWDPPAELPAVTEGAPAPRRSRGPIKPRRLED